MELLAEKDFLLSCLKIDASVIPSCLVPHYHTLITLPIGCALYKNIDDVTQVMFRLIKTEQKLDV